MIAMEKLNVTRSITEAARELGYPITKPEQLDITVAFVEGEMYSVFYLLAIERAYATRVCPTLLTS